MPGGTPLINRSDHIEEYGGVLHAFEFKWYSGKKHALPKTFAQHYPGSQFEIISPDNYDVFLS